MVIAADTVKATPFVKWAGGKSQLLPALSSLAPTEYANYFEPFVGSGALFFHLSPTTATLNDSNEELINCYRVVRDKVEELIDDLRYHTNEKEHFYRMRQTDPGSLTDVQRASRLVFLNRTCFNGLYRVNKSGQFNTPFGSYQNPRICNSGNLRLVSAALRDVTLLAEDFSEVVEGCRAGDFVYFDPPYLPISKYSDFKRYTKDFFYKEDHVRLAHVFRRLDRRGCLVMLSNSYHPFILQLYEGYRTETVTARRLINKIASRRGGVPELIVTNY